VRDRVADERCNRHPEGERLDVLVTLVEAYERQHFPLDLPDPVEAVKFVMEQRGLTMKDLEPMIGHSNRVSLLIASRDEVPVKTLPTRDF
jgi:HTH-type transcriptional regulator/antitoxin HigA